MPVYNAGKYLRVCIDSILCQTYTNFEFLIYNDGSTDESDDIIRSYSDSRIKYTSFETNRGYVLLLNQGITEKIVLSRIFSFPQQGLTAESVFNSFNEKFPNAAVFAFTDEQHAQWVGATPELLFKKRGLSYTTISLAGTRKAGGSENWGTKEIQEQKTSTGLS